jgi:hypothetical protein
VEAIKELKVEGVCPPDLAHRPAKLFNNLKREIYLINKQSNTTPSTEKTPFTQSFWQNQFIKAFSLKKWL